MYTKDRYTGEKLLKAPLKLVGAKSKTRDTLYQLYPEHYSSYIEPFMGSGAVFMGRDNMCVEYVGDTNPYAINFYKMIQEYPEGFYSHYQADLSELKVYGKPCFETHKKRLVETECPIKQAVSFYLVTKACMNGIVRFNKKGECNSSYCGTPHGRGWMDQTWFEAVQSRIEDVRFREVNYDKLPWKEDSFVFLDPPYYQSTGCYMSSWKESDFRKFFRYCLFDLDFGGVKFMLTINDTPFIRELFVREEFGWHAVPHSVGYSCSQTPAGRGARQELIITNYPVEEKAIAIGLI